MATNNHFFYVLYCQDDTFYGGYTTDLKRRLKTHRERKGAKYTRVKKRHPLQLIYAEAWTTKEEAMSKEYAFKKLTRAQKENYLANAGVLHYTDQAFVLVNCKGVNE